MEKIAMLEKAIKESEKIVFFGGAGVSTESGIPDFRSANGIFMQETGLEHSPEEIISIDFFHKYPKQYFNFHLINSCTRMHCQIVHIILSLNLNS